VLELSNVDAAALSLIPAFFSISHREGGFHVTYVLTGMTYGDSILGANWPVSPGVWQAMSLKSRNLIPHFSKVK
jgi:hypothetical protein